MKKLTLKRVGVFFLRGALVLFVLGLLIFGYMHYEFRQIKVTTLSLPSKLKGLKIVYATDFQYDLGWEEKDFQTELYQKSIDLINAQKADLILLGGDYINYPANVKRVAGYLAQLEAPLGVYGVWGNHDYTSKDQLATLLEGKIRFLENEQLLIPTPKGDLLLSGVEDLWKGDPSVYGFARGEAPLSLFLSHNPDFFEGLTEEELADFDLTLSGHTHGGQITFFGIAAFPPAIQRITRYGEKYRYGLKNYDGHQIYISSGLGGGVAGLPIRFGAPPEILLLTTI